MNRLYDDILDSLRAYSQTQNNDAAFFRYLRSLQPSVRQLFESLNGRSQVQVDYSTLEIQLAYLIRYYPYYAQTTQAILQEIDSAKLPFQAREVRVCLFGAGSAPEVLGLVDLLSKNFPQVKSLKIHIFDIANETWTISRDIAQKYLLPKYWKQKQLSIVSHTLDFCSVDSFLQVQEIIRNSQLFIFQNCLNELTAINEAIDNIQLLLQAMPASSNLIIIDLSQYASTDYAIRAIQARVEKLPNSSIVAHKKLEVLVTRDLPSELRTYLLDNTHGCIPKRSVKCSFISIYKAADEESISELLESIQALEARTAEIYNQLDKISSTLQIEQPKLQKQLDRYEVQGEDFEQKIDRMQQDFAELRQKAGLMLQPNLSEGQFIERINYAEQKVNRVSDQANYLSRQLKIMRRIIGAIGLLTFALVLYSILR